jgi:hypothetical protein
MSTDPAQWAAVHRVRLGHVRKLLHHRYGTALPDDDAGSEDLRILLHVKAHAYSPARREQALLNEIGLLAPWMPADRARQLAAEIAANPMKLKADTLGRMLTLDSSTRDRLRIWQIGAIDMDAEGRKERRRQRDREHRQRKRQARTQWLAEHSTEQTKPWLAAGVSRATWYRDRVMRQVRRRTRETGASAKYLSSRADGPVSRPRPERAEPSIEHRAAHSRDRAHNNLSRERASRSGERAREAPPIVIPFSPSNQAGADMAFDQTTELTAAEVVARRGTFSTRTNGKVQAGDAEILARRQREAEQADRQTNSAATRQPSEVAAAPTVIPRVGRGRGYGGPGWG